MRALATARHTTAIDEHPNHPTTKENTHHRWAHVSFPAAPRAAQTGTHPGGHEKACATPREPLQPVLPSTSRLLLVPLTPVWGFRGRRAGVLLAPCCIFARVLNRTTPCYACRGMKSVALVNVDVEAR